MSAPQIPPPGPTAASSPAGAAGLVAVPSEIVRLPQELAARLLNGLRTVFVSGTVTGHGADGTLQIRSQFGEIAVRAGSPVPADRQVSLQIPPLSGKAAALTPPQLSRSPIPASLLLSKPASQAPASNGPAPTAGSPTSATATPAAAGPAAPPVATATSSPLAGPSSPSVPTQAVSAPGPLPAGTTAQPAQTPAPAAPVNTATPQPVVPTAASSAGRPSLAPQAPLPAGSPSVSQVAGPATGAAGAPNAPPPSVAPPLGRLALSAQLLTQTGGQPPVPPPVLPNQPAIQPQTAAPQPQGTPSQPPVAPGAGTAPVQSSVQSSGPVPPTIAGTSVAAATVTATGAQKAISVPVSAGHAGDDAIPIDSARRVPSLREAVSALSAADPALATQFVRSVLPQANTQLAATLLFFLSATRSGDIRGWMGERVATTLDDSGRADLLPKLSAELATPARALPDAPAGEWRSQTVPLYQDGDIGGMAVHVRRGGEDGGEAGDGEAPGHRFLIDMDLSRMGPLQFDGLVHDTRFDLTIRSPAAFPEPMRQDMRTLFRDASDAVGLHGGLTFQAGGHDWATVATARGG